MTPSLSVIVPTVGRPVLLRLLEDLAPDLEPTDEVIVVGDGPQPQADLTVQAMACDQMRYVDGPATGCYGNAQRQLGMSLARGSHLCFFDDDDRVLVGGLRILRRLASAHPMTVVISRMIDKHSLILWQVPEVRQGNVSTQMLLVPNVPPRLGVWGDRYEGDYDFLTSTLAYGWPVQWSPTILADCRP